MRYSVIIIISLLFTGCREYSIQKNLMPAAKERILLVMHADSLQQIINNNPPLYHRIISGGRNLFSSFQNRYGDSSAGIILRLNRVDENNLSRIDTLVVPDSITKNILFYAPFPLALKFISDIPRIIFISQKIQAFAAYEHGLLVRWGPTSTGKKTTPTPTGLFHTNWKAKETISTSNDEWLLKWSFNIDNFNGVSIHEYELPGYPASHSCTRLLSTDAIWFYYWAQQWIVTNDQEKILAYGTPVIIFGEYNFNGLKPWHNPSKIFFSKDEIFSLTAPYLYKIVTRQVNRETLLIQKQKVF